MKNFILFLTILATTNIYAKNICSLTFNSTEEKNALIKNLSPLGYKLIELVPSNKDPNWFNKACKQVDKCDIVIISGHFGGIFFGEQAVTLSLNDLQSAKKNQTCKSIIDSPSSVFLMGCNTLAGKTPDHRNVDDYLRVLVGDGFPLNLAQDVAAARYLNFGESMSETMSNIFSKSKMIIGFDSTSPLGSTNGPLLNQALTKSSKQDKINFGISEIELKKSFSSTNLRVIHPTIDKIDSLRIDALSSNSQIAENAWSKILSSNNLSKYYNFIIFNSKNENLKNVLVVNNFLAEKLKIELLKIFKDAQNLSAIKIHILDFLIDSDLIDFDFYRENTINILENLISLNIDYVTSGQICSILKTNQTLNLLNNIDDNALEKIKRSKFRKYIYTCAGINESSIPSSKAYRCLVNQETYDWGCLTENPNDLDVKACTLAKSRNPNPENADDMMWFCYSKMLENKYLNQSSCLELTDNFTLLGNQLKMNWNCLNNKDIIK